MASLETLTNELFEWVVSFLELEDIRSLRLASQATAFKATQDRFYSFFKTKSVELTRSDLRAFARITSEGRQLGRLLENLTLVGLVYDVTPLEVAIRSGSRYTKRQTDFGAQLYIKESLGPEEMCKAKQDLSILQHGQRDYEDIHNDGTAITLLSEALTSIVELNNAGLKSLNLKIVSYHDDPATQILPSGSKNQTEIFSAASDTFLLAMSSLRISHIPIRNLNVYSNGPDSVGCSLPHDTLGRIQWSLEDFGPSLASLEELSISISDRLLDETQFYLPRMTHPDLGSLREKLDDKLMRLRDGYENDCDSLTKLLRLCCSIQTLDLSYYSIPRSDPELDRLKADLRYRQMHHLAAEPPCPTLRKLNLAGFPVQGDALLKFILNNRSSLRSLKLDFIRGDSGTWSPLFKYLASDDCHIEFVRLEDLRENGIWLSFPEPRFDGEWTMIIPSNYLEANIVERSGETVKRLIRAYRDGSLTWPDEVRDWMNRKSLEYGTP